MTSEIILSTRNLSKRFGSTVVADNISFSLCTGERRSIIGPNGAGKTSFVGLLTGVVTPDAGSIWLGEREITKYPVNRRVKSGLVRTFQITSIFRNFTVLENLFLARSEHVGASKMLWRAASGEKEIYATIDAILERIGLTDQRHRTVSELSYGQQRLIEVGIALCLNPSVLVLDEPAAGLSDQETNRLIEIVDRLPQRLSIIVIEHDMEIVKRLASQITVLVRGRILMTDTPHNVLASKEVRDVYLGRVDDLEPGAAAATDQSHA